MNEQTRSGSCMLGAMAALSPCWGFHPRQGAASSSPFTALRAADTWKRKKVTHSLRADLNRRGTIRMCGMGGHLVHYFIWLRTIQYKRKKK